MQRADFIAFCRTSGAKSGLTLADTQLQALRAIAPLAETLRQNTSFTSRLRFWRTPPPLAGFYLWGPPGGGKTMLLDFFCQFIAQRKRRVHFIDLMRDIHARLRDLRQEESGDPAPKAGQALAAEAPILCCDEFQVDDIADAEILSRFFASFWQAGGILAATSNLPPKNLYAHGLQRRRFLPFLDLLAQNCRTIAIMPDEDYRLRHLSKAGFYYFGAEAAEKFEQSFAMLTGTTSAAAAEIRLESGRVLKVPLAAEGIARFHFDDLCGKPLGTEDYLALTRHYHTLFLARVPRLGEEARNEAKRFMLLIDALYDRKIRLVIEAETAREALYLAGDGAAAFQRTISRLAEMSRPDWGQT